MNVIKFLEDLAKNIDASKIDVSNIELDEIKADSIKKNMLPIESLYGPDWRNRFEKKKRDKERIFCFILGLLIGLSIFALTDYLIDKGQDGIVIGKHEHEGKCYVDLQVEVSENDYIGLDIGDEVLIGD